MRKLLAFALSVTLLFASAGALGAEAPVGMSSFMALAIRSSAGKTVVGLNGKVPLFWFDGKTFFICEIETAKTKDGAEYKKPKTDKEGKPVICAPSSKDFTKKALQSLTSGIYCVLEPQEAVAICVRLENTCLYGVFSKQGAIRFSQIGTDRAAKIGLTKPNMVYILDQDYNRLVLALGNTQKVVSQEAPNPDTADPERCLGIKDVLPYECLSFEQLGRGHLQIWTGKEEIVSCGIRSSCPQVTATHQGSVAASLELLCAQLGCSLEKGTEQNEFVIHRFVSLLWEKPAATELRLKIGQFVGSVDGKRVDFPFPPYLDQKTKKPMVPLRAFCNALGARIHWRTLDSSALVERFVRK
ncbi:MAG: hypothetical protein GX421_07895 [Caldisericales bacterium]|nr:hypothetical protein [Caldisericales bacterium]